MKQSLIIMAVMLVALVLTACGGGSATEPTPIPPTPTPLPAADTPTPAPITQPENVWERVQAEGKIKVGTSADYPPFEYYDDNFLMDGFDIALMDAIAEQLDLDVEMTDIAFDGLADAIQLGQIDIAIAAISVTPEREGVIDFSHIYFVTSDAFVAANDAQIGEITKVEDLAQYRLGVQSGSVYQNWLEDALVATGLMPETNLFIYGQIEQGFPDLEAGRVDILVMDKPVADVTVEKMPFKIVAEDLNRQKYAIAMAKGQTELRTRINQALLTLQQNGTVAELAKQYIDPDFVLIPTPSPTPTPTGPTPTPVPPAACRDGMAWVADLNYDDNNMHNPPVLQPGQPFQKGWKIKNTGTCTWNNNYVLTFVQGNQPGARMGGQPTPIQEAVAPAATYDMYIDLVAPVKAGTYQGFWQMKNPAGQAFGQRIYVGITVPAGATPTPAPTATPSSDINFWTDRDQIKVGECTNSHWRTSNVKEVYYYRDGQNWQDNGVSGNGDRQECPQKTTTYYLRVVKSDNTVVTPSITIHVEQNVNAPHINYYTLEPGGQIPVGQCVTLKWEVVGNVNTVNLTRNNNAIWQGAPFRGSMQDCPPGTGDMTYVLEAKGPGGTSKATQHVRVVENQPTATPPPSPGPIIYSFSANPTEILVGECTTLGWSTGGGTDFVRLLRDGSVILDGAGLNGSQQDCLGNPGQVTYELQASSNSGDVESAQVFVNVQQAAPPTNTPEPLPTDTPAPEPVTISNFQANPPQIDLNNTCTTLTWDISGPAAFATLFRNGDLLAEDPSSGYQDCVDPALAGQDLIYVLKADSEFGGSDTAQIAVTFVGATPR